jgi:hypothetical protein
MLPWLSSLLFECQVAIVTSFLDIGISIRGLLLESVSIVVRRMFVQVRYLGRCSGCTAGSLIRCHRYILFPKDTTEAKKVS